MRFYIMTTERPARGLDFEKPLAPKKVVEKEATRFAKEPLAAEALAKALAEAQQKMNAHIQKRNLAGDSTARYSDAAYCRLLAAVRRLSDAAIYEEPDGGAAFWTEHWAVAVEDGQWLELRSGRCALTPHVQSATVFYSEDDAREVACDTAWTLDAEPQKMSATIVCLAVRLKTATPVFGSKKTPGAINGFVARWVASQERDAIAQEVLPEASGERGEKPSENKDAQPRRL